MIAAPHFAAGLVAAMAGACVRGSVAFRVVAAFTIGLLSHVLMDAVPHSDYSMVTRSSIPFMALGEILVVSLVARVLLRHKLPTRWPAYLIAGMAGSVLLDIKFLARLLLPGPATAVIERHGDWIHSFFHASPMSEPLIGLAGEAATTVILLLMLTAFGTARAASGRCVARGTRPPETPPGWPP